MGFEPTTSAIVNCVEYNRRKACFAGSAGMCSATMVSLKPERKLKKERLEETMIQQTSFERKTGEQVSALVQTLKRMIAGESDSDVYDLKECKALDISSTMP